MLFPGHRHEATMASFGTPSLPLSLPLALGPCLFSPSSCSVAKDPLKRLLSLLLPLLFFG